MGKDIFQPSLVPCAEYIMPQLFFPFFPEGVTHINSKIAFEKRDGKIFYFNGSMPVFIHDEDDLATLRLFHSQLYLNGNATQAEIARAFGITQISVKRAVKLYQQEGAAGFYSQRKGRGSSVLTPDVLNEVQGLLGQGIEIPDISKKLNLKKNTLQKAIRDGRLHQGKKKI